MKAQTTPPLFDWEKSFGGSEDDRGNSIRQTADGGLIMAGESISEDGDVAGNYGGLDFWIVKSDSLGNIMWKKTLGGSGFDMARSVLQTPDGGYIIAGSTSSDNGNVSGNHLDNNGNPTTDFWIVKLNINGALQWQKCLGGNMYDEARAIEQTTDGGFIVAGYTSSNNGDVSGNHGGYDSWVVKLNSLGNIEWQKCLGGSGSDRASCLQQVADGGYIVAGWTDSNDGDVSGNHGDYDYWIVKLNPVGNIEWQKCLGGSGSDGASSLLQVMDGGYIIAGHSSSNDGDVSGNHGESDYWIVKLNESGYLKWQKSFGGSSSDGPQSMMQSSDGGFVIAGRTDSNNGDVSGNHLDNGYTTSDYWIIKIDSLANLQMQSCLGGSHWEVANSVHSTANNGFIVLGYSDSNDGNVSENHGGDDFWIVKYSCNKPQFFYADADNDAFGDINISMNGFSCYAPAGYVTDSSDCDDGDNNIYPGAPDNINGIDDNCNGYLDEPVLEWQVSFGGSKNDEA